MSSIMCEWAKREVEIACKDENLERKESKFDYGRACYESALKAYTSLREDSRKGISLYYARHILNRLIDGYPLTPIEDTEDVWTEILSSRGQETKQYQCERRFSLFKYVHSDGTVTYDDWESACVVANLTFPGYSVCQSIVKSMFPITFPYMPTGPVKVYVDDFTAGHREEDCKIMGVRYIRKPNGEKFRVERYFEETESGWVEIDINTYNQRRLNALKRRLEKQ